MAGRKLVTPKEKSDSVDKIKCLKCSRLKAPNTQNFYANTNPLFCSEKLEICKECILNYIGEKGSNGYLDRVIQALALLDKPWIAELWSQRDEDWSKYIPQLASFPQYKGFNFSNSTLSKSAIQKEGRVSESATVSEIDDFEYEMQDDHKFYSSKWMGEYTKTDIDYLEEYYIGLDRDFKIVTTNHKDYARKICKASLHMDKCFQEVLSGINGADNKYKAARETFDTLSKSAQFSESQRGQNDVGLGCFGVTFDQVEQNKWIPKHIPMDEDAIDKMISQFATIKDSI